jgi:hypothetical protein
LDKIQGIQQQIIPVDRAQDSNDFESIKDLFTSKQYTTRIFLLRLLTIFDFLLCIVFTILCLITLLFVTCCHNLKSSKSSRHNRRHNKVSDDEDDFGDGNGIGGGGEHYDSHNESKKSCCCKCNCLLCPFSFFSFFSFFALITCACGIGVYLYTLISIRNAKLIIDPKVDGDLRFLPDHITRAYQINSWLLDINQLGISFFAALIALGLYLLVFILSTCITCRMEISQGWRGRYSDTYEVLQMNDLMLNSKNDDNNHNANEQLTDKEKRAAEKEEKKRLKKEKKEKEKEKKKKKQSIEDNGDNGLEANETQALTAPKTRITAIDDEYD